MNKPTIAVIFGSRSTEHDVSIITALAAVIKPLELLQKYEVVPVYIAKDGRWFSGSEFKDIALFRSGRLDTLLKTRTPVSLQFENGQLLLVTPKRLRTDYQKIDIVFPALHGTHGEDGEVMALCELANIPYVGCDVRSSVIAMDKVLSKQVVAQSGILTPAYKAFTTYEYESDSKACLASITSSLTYPLFVKPAHLGSSIGISRALNAQELENAIEVALHYDNKVLVEEAVSNLIEVTLPIMGNEELQPAFLEQPLSKSEDFFDFDAKYMHGGKKGKGGKQSAGKGAQGYSTIPADLPKHLYAQAEATGLAAYRAIGCQGLARIDMLIDSKSEKVYFNEVNPLPGSLYAHNWRQKGVSNMELVARLVDLAIERHAKQKAIETVFTTSYLKQF